MRDYDFAKYINLVENTDNKILQDFMSDENEILSSLDFCNKDIFDLGAGYGRVLQYIPMQTTYYGFELNNNMFPELEKRCSAVQNFHAIKEDITNKSLFNDYLSQKEPTILLLQNTLGTIEGKWKDVLSNIKSVLSSRKSSLIISLFHAEQLSGFGRQMFNSLEPMVGEIDSFRSDILNGIFISKTGYMAKWWSTSEINDILSYLGGRISSYKKTNYYSIYYLESDIS